MKTQPGQNYNRSQNIHFATYTSAIDITILPDTSEVLVHGPLWIKSKTLAKNLNIKIGPAEYLAFYVQDFYSDGASIPRPLWWYAHPFDHDILLPAIAHDFIYRKKTIRLYVYNSLTGEMRDIGERFIPRKAADDLMREKMADFGASIVKRNVVHKTLRAVGSHAWQKTYDKIAVWSSTQQ